MTTMTFDNAISGFLKKRLVMPAACAALCLFVAACYDEYPMQAAESGVPGEAVVSLSVPGTRAVPVTGDGTGEAAATGDERAVRSLWFLAYPTEGGEGEAVVQQLNTDKLEHETPRTFNIRMKFGTYNIYVVANVPAVGWATTEEELKGLMLNYKGEDGSLVLPDPADGLPMFYQSSAPFEVNAQGGVIQADLEFCCVKVRYTLQFDNTDFSKNTFGDSYVKITSVSGKQIATEVPLVPTGQAIENLPLLDTAEGAFNGQYAEDFANGKWSYTATFYLPEHYVDNNEKQTYLDIQAELYDKEGVKKADLAYTIELGETLPDASEENKNLRQLPRARYYDITGKIKSLGDKIESTVAVQDWTPVSVDAELESPYHLWVEKTSIPLTAGEKSTFAIRTDAPKLEYFSPTMSFVKEGVVILPETDKFVVTFNEDYTTITIQINPAIPGHLIETHPDEFKNSQYNYILIRIPDPETDKFLLSKRIDFEPVKFEPYLRVTPSEHMIYIRDIANKATHSVEFEYETNMDELEVKYGDIVIPAGESIQVSDHLRVENTGLDADAKNGKLIVTLDEPNVPAHFPSRQELEFTYTASYESEQSTSERTATTRVVIIPNAQKYTLHFRPVDDSWTNPHIYAYQVLYTPNNTEILLSDQDDRENAVLYSFTGNKTFLGWTEQGGSVTYDWKSQIGGEAWADRTIFNPDGGSGYTSDIDYCPDYHTNSECSACNSGVNPKWPGVRMKDESNGWFCFEVPALASPGTTLIMFADDHSQTADLDAQNRYPARYIPGVPLYNYADKEGWFLYDYTKGENNEFVDDKPNVLDKADVLPDGFYRIWCTTTFTHIHVWGDGDYTNYNDNSGLLKTDVATGKKYFDIQVSSTWNPKTVRYLFHTDNDKTDDLVINFGEWRRVTGKSYAYEVYK